MVEAFCGSSSVPFDSAIFVTAIPANGSSTATLSFSVPNAPPCTLGSFVTYRIRPITHVNRVQCLCTPTSYTPQIILPVDLLRFEANKVGAKALLQWQTTSERNMKEYSVERSADGSNWASIDRVQALSSQGNSSETFAYKVIDETPWQGMNFYRLSMRELSGAESFSPIRRLYFGTSGSITVYPNPTKQSVIVEGLTEGDRITLTGINGQELQQWKVHTTTTILDISKYANGLYILQILDASGTVNRIKLTKE